MSVASTLWLFLAGFGASAAGGMLGMASQTWMRAR